MSKKDVLLFNYDYFLKSLNFSLPTFYNIP